MSAFPNSPRLAKDGIVQVDPDSAALQKILVLQYKPAAFGSALQPQVLGGEVP